MNLDDLRKYCLAKECTDESFPFGKDTLVYKVSGKIFAITSFSQPLKVNLKCNPEMAVELRELYEEIEPGYHMNKKHWNTVNFEGKIPVKKLKQLIDHSYDLVANPARANVKRKHK